MGYLDEAITELDGMESTLSSYKIHLNVWMVDHLHGYILTHATGGWR